MTKLLSTLVFALGAGLALPALAQTPAYPNTTNPYLKNVPAPAPNPMTLLPKGSGAMKDAIPWAMSATPTAEQKKQLMKSMMPLMANMGLNIRDVMNYMTTKYQAKAGVSFDDVVESMKLRANQLNLKLVGHSPMIKDIQAVLGDTTSPRMEVFHFCDIAAGREIMKLVPEAIVYLPCRIAVMEDDKRNVWVLTLDWDMAWLDSINGSMGITPEIAKMAVEIRDKMDNVMRAGANGDL
ncbi:MAG: DUF302 domain-containing protein [Thiobacillus sp.]|nr:DUF302 domain-containing protein [Thiobacillus sp.]